VSVDLEQLFRLDVSGLELVLRTTLIYIGLLTGFRIVARRRMGSLAVSDMLIVVLIADGVQNGMSGHYNSVTGAAIVAATLLCWDVLLDALAARSKLVERLLSPPPLRLIENGHMLRRNMRKEFITEEELASKLRAHGIQEMARVKLASLESDGELSVITRDGQPQQPPARQHRGLA
jgi:uncharacterized membrane protein YcaP (DUF421 family)